MAVSQLKSDLEESRARLFDAIRGLTEEQFRFVAADGDGWPIAAHLAHLLRIERVFAERARAALEQDEPHMPSTRVQNDGDPGASQKLAVPQIIHGMLNARRDLVAVLDACDEAAVGRAIIHERLGRMDIAAIAAKMASHEAEHSVEVARLVRQVPPSGRVIIPLTRRS
jgi:hypothetical protein